MEVQKNGGKFTHSTQQRNALPVYRSAPVSRFDLPNTSTSSYAYAG